MSNNSGWVKLHRKLKKWEWYKNSIVKDTFIEILLTANVSEGKFEGRTIYPGQLITSRKSLADETGLSEQNIRTALNKLKSTNDLTIESTSKFTLITVVNWEKYQSYFKKSTNTSTKCLTNNQPATNHNIRIIRNKEEENKRPLCNFEGELEDLYDNI